MELGRILNGSPAEVAPRTGKWTMNEERYAATLVNRFLAGSLAIPSGTSLRSFLAMKLRCSRMRISTKLATETLGDMTIPKRLGQKRFFPTQVTESQRRHVTHELSSLRAAFMRETDLPDNESDEDTTSDAGTITGKVDTEEPLRTGCWSKDEEIYAEALIEAFLCGAVRLNEGATLRAFLADQLCCNAMRVSKKLATGKMGRMLLPKRLGSATYRNTMTPTSDTYEMERNLEHLRLNCFASAPLGSPTAPLHHENQRGTRGRGPAQQHLSGCSSVSGVAYYTD